MEVSVNDGSIMSEPIKGGNGVKLGDQIAPPLFTIFSIFLIDTFKKCNDDVYV